MDVTGPRVRDTLVLALALAAACVDAISFMGLDEVLTANMTGNTVLLGLALARLDLAAAGRSGVALAAFACGAGAVALLPRRTPEQRLWPAPVTAALAMELVLLAALGSVWVGVGVGAYPWLRYVLTALAAFAMGAQSAAVTRLRVHGVATTYVTGTVTSLATDVVTWRRASGRRLRLGVLVVYVGGAVIGGAAYLGWGTTATLIPAGLLAAVTLTAAALHVHMFRKSRRR
ncbi:MAG: DUF1275 domain-containing protein [Streptosporangiales bacterium]|nr:DUF1275 domain-containing protein [Streptosporangiales bacterium]